MFDELLPHSLSVGAARLGVEPLEVVRLMVESGSLSDGFELTGEHIRKLTVLGGIESGWWDGVELPADTNPSRAVVRAVLGILASRGVTSVRMDNLWRGCTLDNQGLIEDALNVLDEEGILQILNAPAGIQVVVDTTNLVKIQGIASGAQSLPGLDELYQG